MLTFSGDGKFSLHNCENLWQPNQIHLSEDQNTFSEFSASFLKATSNLEHFGKKVTLIAYVFPKLRTAKDVVRPMFKKRHFRTLFESQHGSQILFKYAR